MTRAGLIVAAMATGMTPTVSVAQMHMPGMAMPGMQMPGMAMPAKPTAKSAVRPKPPARRKIQRKATGKAAAKISDPTPAMSEPTAATSSPITTMPDMTMPDHTMPGHTMPGHSMPGPMMPNHTMPDMATPQAQAPCSPEHAAMGHCTAPDDATPARRAGAAADAPVGTDQPAGNAPPPAPPTTLAAARFYDPATMARADRMMRDEHGGMRFSQILFNLAELQVRDGRDGYRWDGDGWFGGDIDRFVVKSEGEGDFGGRVDSAEVQALYSRAVDPYWNLQAGLRQDFGAAARRTYATIGIEGLAPYWFDVSASLFVSDKGDVLARGEAWYDQRITQRLVVQPRIELNFAAQDVRASRPAGRVAAGVSDAELGVRLRYEIAREFAPYVGLSWQKTYSPATRDARSSGGFALALGLRGWF